MSASARWRSLPTNFRSVAARSRGAVLLETARPDRGGERSLLFLDPVAELVARSADELEMLLLTVDAQTAAGNFVAGYFAYEAGESFAGLSPSTQQEPLARLGVFRERIEFDHRSGAVRGVLPDVAKDSSAFSGELLHVDGLRIAKPDYDARIRRIQEYLAAGHTYQVNFTDCFPGSVNASPLAIYNTLLMQQPVSFAAYVNRPDGPVLSFSPELFYRAAEGRITVRPMKGTWARGWDLATDRAAEEFLRSDEKNHSEHITIVDLLRNDLGRVCELGSVHVDQLLEVERYATLLQMTTTISGTLQPELAPSAIFRRLFPSGSITGAPKKRTMEIIRELELGPRGVYTGAIGYFAPRDEACFNVAIRTMDLHGDQFKLGVGGGITADSRAEDEYHECLLKAAFLTRRDRPFSLIETMHAQNGIALLDQHLRRLADSAAYFDIAYDAAALRAELTAITSADENRVRLLLHLDGAWQITVTPLDHRPWRGEIQLSRQRVQSNNLFLHHKTTNRSFYDEHFKAALAAGFDEVLFVNERGAITEGCISNVFFEIGERWVTPALHCGVLPGVKRAELLVAGALEEEIIVDAMRRATRIRICNALRGVREVSLVRDERGDVVWQRAATKD